MTERWKSNPMHWCDLCKCWMQDTKASILNHERGTKHQEALARKLRDMAKKAEVEKAEKRALDAALGGIEAAASAAYARDAAAAAVAERAAAAAAAAAAGVWEWDAGSGYYYNEAHRWYYDSKQQWYYGGDPPEWARDPPAASLPASARFGAAPHVGGPVPASGGSSGSGVARPAAGGVAAASGGGAAAAAAAGSSAPIATVKKVIALPAHPQAMIGGHQLHHVSGRIGGAKGVGGGASGGDDGGGAAKRKRDGPGGGGGGSAGGGKQKKPVDPAEAAALARREAARQRVAARTQQAFGLS